ncbi:peptidyl-alpha-hydroxyglycine alpha-amidating lyase 2-like [Argonauta hians]
MRYFAVLQIFFLLTACLAVPRHHTRWNTGLPFYNDAVEIGYNNVNREVRWPTNLRAVPEWPEWKDATVRQVSSLDTNQNGDVVLFHRGTRQWGARSFDRLNNFRGHGAIKQNTIVTLSNSTGTKVSSFGANLFYLPHGITVDHENNIWTTDVGLHQVMKFPPGANQPSMILGTRRIPGTDKNHFCKPTDVAVASNGQFFVADGYCNSRVMKFSKNGTFLAYIGNNYQMNVVHSITLVEQLDRIYVADRENKRILCFKAGLKDARETGKFVSSLVRKKLGRIYAVNYDPNMNVLYVVSMLSGRGVGSTIGLLNGEIIANWTTGRNQNTRAIPHDIAVAPNGRAVYVTDILNENNPLFKLQY